MDAQCLFIFSFVTFQLRTTLLYLCLGFIHIISIFIFQILMLNALELSIPEACISANLFAVQVELISPEQPHVNAIPPCQVDLYNRAVPKLISLTVSQVYLILNFKQTIVVKKTFNCNRLSCYNVIALLTVVAVIVAVVMKLVFIVLS